MARRAIRFPDQILKRLDEGSKQRGFVSPSAFIRYAVEQELFGRGDDLTGAEERPAASMEQVRHDLFLLMRVQQALFAYVDTLAKTILTCMPEPPTDAKPRGSRERKSVMIIN